ncbi:MAG: hypothetical protein H0W73_04935 [Bacteroidetes bacterium]|nr:hypothetical protein [Bacteroidota bacterium]
MREITLTKDQKRKFSDEYFVGGKALVSPLKQTGEGLLRDVAIGVIGGGLASALLGRYSFLLGLGLTGYGHYSENKMLSALGLGMMASGTFSALTGKDQDKNKPIGEKVTERFGAFKSEMKRKLWLDYFEENKGKKKNEKATGEDSLSGASTFDHQEQLMNQQKTKTTDYFKKEKIASVNPEDFPELNEKEKSFLEKKVDLAISREMNLFLENRQAVASYLENGEKPVEKKETQSKPEQKQDAIQKEREENFKSHVQEIRKTEKKNTSNVKNDSYPDYEPEPQELIF